MTRYRATWTGRSSRSGTARWRANSTPGPRRTCRTLHGADVDAACRELVRAARRRRLAAPRRRRQQHGAADVIDTRAICLIRETLARHNGLADFAFAMQGLGSGAISLQGTPQQKERYLSRVAARRGHRGLRAVRAARPAPTWPPCSARPTSRATTPCCNGEKTWISNGGIADFYVVFCRTGEAPGARGISAFIVDAGTPGFEIAERIDVIAPHPLARLRFDNCRVPLTQRIGEAGEGFKVAMRTLDVFRTSVAAAALGFARRALDEALQRATTRKMFNQTLADFQLTQAKLAQMATDHRQLPRCWSTAPPGSATRASNVTKEAAMAKMTATEGAQQVIDAAVQMFGGLGVVSGADRSSSCTARSARCASTKARPKCSS